MLYVDVGDMLWYVMLCVTDAVLYVPWYACYVKNMCYDMCCGDIYYGMFPWVGWPASQHGGEEPARGRRLDRAKGHQPDNLS